MTEDPAMARVPRCCVHDGTLCAFFDAVRAYRRMAEVLVIAEDEYRDGRISDADMRTVDAKYASARADLLKADERVRKGTS